MLSYGLPLGNAGKNHGDRLPMVSLTTNRKIQIASSTHQVSDSMKFSIQMDKVYKVKITQKVYQNISRFWQS